MSGTTSGNDAQSILEKARAMLQQSGAPMTAENLNRASLAISQGQTGVGENGFDSAMETALNDGRAPQRTVSNVMTPVPTVPGNGVDTQDVRINAGVEAGAMNPLRDRTMAANPAQYNGTRADQPGQRDTQANLLNQTKEGDADSIESRVAGSLNEPSSAPVTNVPQTAQQTSASAPQNGGPRPPLNERVTAAADSPYMGMFMPTGGVAARAAPLLERAAGSGTAAIEGTGPLMQRMLAAPAERTMIPTRSAPPEIIPMGGTTVGPMQAAMLQGPGAAANSGARAARRGTTGQRARQ